MGGGGVGLTAPLPQGAWARKNVHVICLEKGRRNARSAEDIEQAARERAFRFILPVLRERHPRGKRQALRPRIISGCANAVLT